MMRIVAVLALSLCSTLVAAKQWQLAEGETRLLFDRNLLANYQMALETLPMTTDGDRTIVVLEVDAHTSNVSYQVQNGVGEKLAGQGLVHRDSLTLIVDGEPVALAGLRVVPGGGQHGLDMQVFDADGQLAFTVDYAHRRYDDKRGELKIYNADLRIGPALAARIGKPEWTGLVIGQLEMNLQLDGSVGDLAGLPSACDARPLWPQPGGGIGCRADRHVGAGFGLRWAMQQRWPG